MKHTEKDFFFMRLAIDEACKARECGEIPVGAVLIDESGQILAKGHNQPIASHDPTAHAEIVTLREAALCLKNYRLPGSIMYVTLEPCVMCFGALVHARIQRVIYGALDPRFGAVVSRVPLAHDSKLNHTVKWEGGVLAQECGKLLSSFFQAKRKNSTNGEVPKWS